MQLKPQLRNSRVFESYVRSSELALQVPSQAVAAGGTFTATVRAEDIGGFTDPTYIANVTLTLSSGSFDGGSNTVTQKATQWRGHLQQPED